MVGLDGDWHIYAGTQDAFGRAPPRVPVTTQGTASTPIAVGQGVLTRRRCRATGVAGKSSATLGRGQLPTLPDAQTAMTGFSPATL
jgi:hypothetical protein